MAAIYHEALFGLALGAMVLTPGFALGAVTLTAEEDLVVPAHEVIDDDLVVIAPYARIDGVVKGDLVVIAEEVVVEGVVERDLIAVGKTVYLNGSVQDDARIGAYAIALGEGAHVADDLFVLAYSLDALEGDRVGGSLYAATRQARLAGSVVEDVLLRAGALEIAGLVGGDVRAVVGGLEGVTHSEFVIDLALEIPVVADGIRVTETAIIGGELDHRSHGPALVESGARIEGGVRHEAWRVAPASGVRLDAVEEPSPLFERMTDAVERLAVLLGVGLLLAVAFPRWLTGQGAELRDRPVFLLGWGIGTVVFAGVASLVVGVVFMTLSAIGLAVESSGLAWAAISGGALLQMLLFAAFGIALFFAGPALASAGLGSAVLARLRPAATASTVTDAMLLIAVGAAVYAIVRAVPFVGWFFGLCATLAGLGALTLWLRSRVLEPRPEA